MYVNGEAERLIRYLSLTEANYSTAWKPLEERFNNKRVLSNTLIQKLLDHSMITKDSKTIKSLHDNVKETLSALNNIGIETDKWDPVLLCLLTKKLDRQKHLLYAQSVQNTRQIQPLNEFLNFLEQRFLTLKAIGSEKGKTPAERLSWVQKQKLCVKCLCQNQPSRTCTNRDCFKCNKKQNTLLHLETKPTSRIVSRPHQQVESNPVIFFWRMPE